MNLFKKLGNIFTRKRDKIIMSPSDFKKGMVIKMKPGYYTKKPYYVLVKNVTKTGITTTIPGEHDLKLDIIKDIATWNHQVSRMTIVGDRRYFGYLLFYQKLN